MNRYVWPAIVAASLLVFAVVGEWSTVIFVSTFAGAYGLLVWSKRQGIRDWLRVHFRNRTLGILIIGTTVSVLEELYCYVLGVRLAHPILWADLVIVTSMWMVWFMTWHLFLSRRFAFTEKEYLFTAGTAGILFEYIGGGISDPLGALLMAPLAISVYMAVFILPSLLMDFDGENASLIKYPVAIFLPYLLMIPVAFIVFPLISLFGA